MNFKRTFLLSCKSRFNGGMTVACVCFLFLLSGCSTYQYVTVTSNKAPEPTGKIVFENDSLRVTHIFSGMEGPAIVEIENKLAKPIQVKWDQSSIEIDEQTLPEIKENTLAINDVSSGSLPLRSVIYDSSTRRYISLPTELLQPRSEVLSQPVYLGSKFLKSYGKKMRTYGQSDSLRQQSYSQDDSPLRFRSRIVVAYSYRPEDTVAIEQEFWVSKVVTANVKPRDMSEYGSLQNIYFVRQVPPATQKATAVAILASIVLVTGWALTDF